MFWSGPADRFDDRPPLSDRVRDALALARALLTLEDDYDVDWYLGVEAAGSDQSEAHGHIIPEARPAAPAAAVELTFEWPQTAPQRRPGRRRRKRRGGALTPAAQVCVCPLPARVPACRQATRAR